MNQNTARQTADEARLSPGYFITAELKIKEESRIREARDALALLCRETLQEPGCSLFVLHYDRNEPSRFVLWERFDDEAAFRAHFEASHTKEYIAKDLTEVVRYFQTDLA